MLKMSRSAHEARAACHLEKFSREHSLPRNDYKETNDSGHFKRIKQTKRSISTKCGAAVFCLLVYFLVEDGLVLEFDN